MDEKWRISGKQPSYNCVKRKLWFDFTLKKVFQWMDLKRDQKLDTAEILEVLTKLGYRAEKREVELMIWEVDDDLDM